ncbi:hypothetical protein [Brevundimonas sp. UBA7664]|uniref:hypothetical protein n=1 Tax=Brevundimonas sp. UBA7664 TaxID=1946141 RepID=UPI0025C09CD7|nr:hypothetical protein [Brevundimonas sp. UBA7664]
MAKRDDLRVEDLLLDVDNPRIGGVASQSEALEAIVNLNDSHFKTMMKSIADHGLDPGDAFYVIADDLELGTYVVVDGNRRLSALKTLQNPALLNGTQLSDRVKKALAKISSDFTGTLPTSVDVVIFDDRAAADEWIERRHGRGLEGEARIPWNPLEIQRFQNDRSILDVIEFVGKNSTFSDDEWSEIKRAVEAKTSVLGRFLEAKVGIDWFGLVVETIDGEDVPSFKVDASAAINFLSKLMSDIRDKVVDSRTHNKTPEIETYFGQHAPASPISAQASPVKFREALVSDGKTRPRQSVSAKTKTASTTKTAKVKPPRRTLAEAKHPFAPPDTEKGKQLLREASKVLLADKPLASAFLLRAFLQHTIDVYMTAHSLPFFENQAGKTVKLDLKTKAERVLSHLVSSGAVSGTELHGVRRTLTGKNDPASIQALNDYHHDRYQIPAADVLRNAWESAKPMFIAVYGKA